MEKVGIKIVSSGEKKSHSGKVKAIVRCQQLGYYWTRRLLEGALKSGKKKGRKRKTYY